MLPWRRSIICSPTARAIQKTPIKFTPIRAFGETEAGNTRKLRNTGRGPGIWSIDLRAEKNFQIGNLLYGAFVRVDNLLDTKNCIQVFESTGRCDAGTIDQNQARQGNAVSTLQVNSTFFDRPQFFDQRRRIAVGARLSF